MQSICLQRDPLRPKRTLESIRIVKHIIEGAMKCHSGELSVFVLTLGATSYLLYREVLRILRSIAVCRDTKTWVLKQPRAEPHS
jgi:hypothetical protein